MNNTLYTNKDRKAVCLQSRIRNIEENIRKVAIECYAPKLIPIWRLIFQRRYEYDISAEQISAV
jgi:hypothetical protein